MLKGPAHLIPLKVRAKRMRPKSLLPFCSSLLSSSFLQLFSPHLYWGSVLQLSEGLQLLPHRGPPAPQPEPGALPGLINLLPARKIWQFCNYEPGLSVKLGEKLRGLPLSNPPCPPQLHKMHPGVRILARTLKHLQKKRVFQELLLLWSL